MIDPKTINPLELPWVMLENRLQLPKTPCIYFAIDSQGVVQYIGKSIVPRQRWMQHHRYNQLLGMDTIRIAYLSVSDAQLLDEIESALISWFNPLLNKTQVKGKGYMTVKKVLEIEVPGLGDHIRKAREADSRTLAEICRQIPMSPMNWYRIEAEETKALPIETLRRIEFIFGVDFGVNFDES